MMARCNSNLSQHATSLNDQRRRFVLSGTFDIPVGDEEEGKKKRSGLANLFSNIEVGPILTVGSGRPFNPLTGFDANRNHAFPLSSRPSGLGRNSLVTPFQVELDLPGLYSTGSWVS